MCLYIDKITTERKLAESVAEEVFYKLFLKREKHIESPYHYFKVLGPGVITHPNPTTWKEAKELVGLETGIFNARTTEEATKQDKFWAEYFTREEYSCVCIPIIVKKEDIIAFGILNDVGVRAYKICEGTWESLNLKR
jgi:hypothetical protein